jgi:putative membrane protein insertion efficiency factor
VRGREAPRPSEAEQHWRPRRFSSQPLSWPRRLLALAIGGYQRFVSPFFPPTCRFEPHCSAYGHEAVLVHGALKGSLLIVWRVLRCQPFCRGGFDPVPERGRWR